MTTPDRKSLVPPQGEKADTVKEIRRVKAALKSGREGGEGFDDIYFADHGYLLEDPEILTMVAKRWPNILVHIDNIRPDKAFVIRWLASIDDPDQVDKVYRDFRTRHDQDRVKLTTEELDTIKKKKHARK